MAGRRRARYRHPHQDRLARVGAKLDDRIFEQWIGEITGRAAHKLGVGSPIRIPGEVHVAHPIGARGVRAQFATITIAER